MDMNLNGFLRYAAAFLPFAALCGGLASAETEGERLFKMNEPAQAVPLLEKEIAEGIVSADSYNFLGLAYFQLGEYEKSLDAFERGMNSPRSDKKRLCLNEGNVAYSHGDYERAEKCYSLALSVAPDFYAALLNRANSRLAQGRYSDAASDYRNYITALPSDSQADAIRRLISILEAEQDKIAADERKFAEEERRLEEEQQRFAAEKERLAAEEERRLAAERERLAAEEERKLAEQEQKFAAEKERLAAEEERRIAEEERKFAEQERKFAAEKERIAAENARIQEEQARQAQARRFAEEERRRRLLEEVTNSLQQADTASMTAGAEDVMGYDYESELD